MEIRFLIWGIGTLVWLLMLSMILYFYVPFVSSVFPLIITGILLPFIIYCFLLITLAKNFKNSINTSVENQPTNEKITVKENPTTVKSNDQTINPFISTNETRRMLPNQNLFNEMLNKSINHAKRRNKICAVLFIDLSTTLNSIDFCYRDQLIATIFERLSSTLRSEDLLTKFNHQQFSLLLSDINQAKFASTVAEKILRTLSKPIQINNTVINTALYIGISIYPNDGNTSNELIQKAQSALKDLLGISPNTYRFFDLQMDQDAHNFIELDQALRQAIIKNELALYYQPQMHIKKGHISGVEAFVRWVHPILGTIKPETIITLAEETGLIMQLGEWALREACQLNRYYQEEGYEHITIGLNISPKQFYHPQIVNLISNGLRDTNMNAKYLQLEINETTVMSDIVTATAILDEIKNLGVQLAIDHFGKGYTSISYLKQFPLSVLKIDSSFIKGLPYHPNDTAITNAFISLAHHLGLEVIAEGVETAEQAEYLTQQNCDALQGYYISHPLPAQKLLKKLRKLRDEVII